MCLWNIIILYYILLDWFLPKVGKVQSTLILTHNWRENRWIHAFFKGIHAKVNTMDLAGIWTQYVNINFCDDNHYATYISKLMITKQLHKWKYLILCQLMIIRGQYGKIIQTKENKTDQHMSLGKNNNSSYYLWYITKEWNTKSE